MAKYYRCRAPLGTCDHAGEIKAGEKLECPSCGKLRVEVKPFAAWVEMNKPILKWVGIGVAALVALLIIGQLFKKDPLKEKIAEIETRLGELEGQLLNLEAKPRGAGSANPMLTLRQLEKRVGDANKLVDGAIEAGDTEVLNREKATLTKLEKQLDKAIETSRNPKSGSGEVVMEARDLVSKYVSLEEMAEEARDDPKMKWKDSSIQQYDALMETLGTGLARASRMTKAAGPNEKDKLAIAAAAKKIREAIVRGRELATNFKPPPKAPFAESEATMRIGATADLPETLVAPLLEHRTTTKAVPVGDDLYIASRPGTQPSAKVIVKRLAAADAFAALTDGRVDLSISGAVPSSGERAKFRSKYDGQDLDSGALADVIALDALTFNVSRGNASSPLLRPADVASQAFPSRGPTSAEASYARQFGIRVSEQVLVPGSAGMHIGAYHQGDHLRIKRLAYQAAPDARKLEPNPFTIATEDYRFSVRIVARNAPNPPAAVRTFVNFIKSDAGQKIIADQNYVDLRLRPQGGEVDPLILAALGGALKGETIVGARRLPTNIRFIQGKDELLDLKAAADLERLPRLLASKRDDERIVILGFASIEGTDAANLRVSIERAERVKAELGVAEIKTGGLGAQFPVDTNETEKGRQRNRRAEIWLAKVGE